jgi:hypothetical protein
MIYNIPNSDDPIQQGDIFKAIPYISYDPERLLICGSEPSTDTVNWIDHSEDSELEIIAHLKSVIGIVVTQDCDTERNDTIALFTIEPLSAVVPNFGPSEKKDGPKWWAENLPKKVRTDQKWFYLPPDLKIGFKERMAIDFNTVIPVPTQYLAKNKAKLRIAKLNSVADEHFREQVAQYYRRYPYNEWYPFSKEEFEEYRKLNTREDTIPYEWQE